MTNKTNVVGARIPWNKGKRGLQKWHNIEGFKKGAGWNKGKKESLAQRTKISKALAGEKSPKWKGGSGGSRTLKHLNNLAYREWRKSVFERDSYTCLICEKVGGMLEAHHIKEWASHKKVRYNINNGATLCKDCHQHVHHGK